MTGMTRKHAYDLKYLLLQGVAITFPLGAVIAERANSRYYRFAITENPLPPPNHINTYTMQSQPLLPSVVRPVRE